MLSSQVIDEIQRIKDSTERPHTCDRLMSFLPHQRKSYLIQRYAEGSEAVMSLLYNELSQDEIHEWDRMYRGYVTSTTVRVHS